MFCPIFFLPLFSLIFSCQTPQYFCLRKKPQTRPCLKKSPNKPARRRRVSGGPLPVKKAGKRSVLKKTDKPTPREGSRPKARTADARLPKSRQKSTNPIQHQKSCQKGCARAMQKKKSAENSVSAHLRIKKRTAHPPRHFQRQHTSRGKKFRGSNKIQGNLLAGRQKKRTTRHPGGGSQKCAAEKKRTKGQDFS